MAARLALAALLAVSLLLSIILLFFSVRWTLADIIHSRGVSALSAAARYPDTGTRWEDGRDLLSTASDLNPFDADYRFYEGYFANKQKTNGSQPENNRAGRDAAPGFYREALELRPHGGHLWAQYAWHLFQNGAGTSETLYAVEKALRFAPYQPAVLLVELEIGLAWWDKLSFEQHRRLQSTVDYLLRYNWRYVIQTAVANELVGTLRPLLSAEEDIARLERALAKQAQENATGN